MRRGFDTIFRGDLGESADDFLIALRPNAEAGITSLDQLASPKLKRAYLRRKALFAAIRKLEGTKAVLIDSKGRRTDTDLVGMTAEAVEVITSGFRVLNGRKGGRPKEYTDEQIKEARGIWQSRKYRTAREALKHMPGWSQGSAYRLLGTRN